MTRALQFPGGARFAFTILDDTDEGTIESVGPVYRLLESLGMRTTKTVWPVACPEGSGVFGAAQTLEDADYAEFVRDLQRRGFEITWHCATMESSERARTERALEQLRAMFGVDPRVHANHARNRENMYWGVDRIDHPLLRGALQYGTDSPPGYFAGHDPASPFWWGDLCAERVVYMRNLTFSALDLMSVNPSMPYHDPARPLVKWWFSATDAEDADEFAELFTPDAIAQLEARGGVCLVATHLGKKYARGGEVDPRVRAALESIARRKGWFPTCGELLDWLRAGLTSDTLPAAEWHRMQWQWARNLFARKVRARFRRSSSATNTGM